MGYLRFRRSVKILPGIRLNIGKRGVSTSIGVRGAHVTFGHGQVRETVGLPETGLSYTRAIFATAMSAGRFQTCTTMAVGITSHSISTA